MRYGGKRNRSGRDKSGGAVVLLIILGVVLAVLAPLIARLLQMACSRQREYLADSTGILFTRYPEGLASALEKIGEDRDPLEAASKANQHLFIVNPFEKEHWQLDSLWSTHPPLEERIKRLRALK